MKYEFPFAIPPKERERATCKGRKAWLYSPASTKKFYTKIRTYINHHYPEYTKNIIDYDCHLKLVIGVALINANNDLDNRLKMLDSLNKDASRKKDPDKFKGIWKDDKLVKKIEAEIVYVENEKDEFSVLELERHEVKWVKNQN